MGVGLRHAAHKAVEGAKRLLLSTGAAALIAVLGATTPAQALSFDITYGSEVSSDIKTAFGFIAGIYSSMFLDPITVNLQVDTGTTGLGGSDTNEIGVTYTQWYNAMVADAKTPTDAIVIANLPSSQPIGPGPSTGNDGTPIAVRTADAKALGLLPAHAPGNDSSLSFNNSPGILNTTGCGGSQGGTYNFCNVAAHELDEALAIGSRLTGIANNGPLDPDYIEPEDFFRFSGPGARSYTTDPTATAYFSINNGITLGPQFNQDNNAGGASFADRNDWIYGNDCGTPKLVQNAVTCGYDPNAFGPASPEAMVLDALGYDLSVPTAAVPEPASMTLLGFGLVGLGVLRRRRR